MLLLTFTLLANLPEDALLPLSAATTTGIYYGFAQVIPRGSQTDSEDAELSLDDRGVYPMAMSLGWNPFYKNKQLTAVSQT